MFYIAENERVTKRRKQIKIDQIKSNFNREYSTQLKSGEFNHIIIIFTLYI